MSSTNVHSKSKKTYFCVSGQSIPMENGEMEIPAEVAQKGPSTMDIRTGPEMEIPVGNSELRADGKLISEGKIIVTLGVEAYNEIAKRKDREKAVSSKESSDKGNDR